MVYLCVFLIVNNILLISRKPPLFPGHMFDVLLNIVIDVLWYCSFCQLNDTFSYLVALTSHLFYYRLHREAITVLSCQSSKTIWMTLFLWFMSLWFTFRGSCKEQRVGCYDPYRSLLFEIFHDSVEFFHFSYVRQWEGLVWTSAMLLRNWTLKSLTSILKGGLSNPRVSIFKYRGLLHTKT